MRVSNSTAGTEDPLDMDGEYQAVYSALRRGIDEAHDKVHGTTSLHSWKLSRRLRFND